MKVDTRSFEIFACVRDMQGGLYNKTRLLKTSTNYF
jgi:hypothetical protein